MYHEYQPRFSFSTCGQTQFYQTSEGEPYARFSLATQESWKDAQGQKHTHTQWHPVVVFTQALVEIVRKQLNKGAYVLVEGKLYHRKVLTDDGREYPVTEVMLTNYHSMLGVLQPGKTASPAQDDAQTEEVLPT